MDFGDILDQWEEETSRSWGKKRIVKDERKKAEALERDAREAALENRPPRDPDTLLPKAHPMDVWMRRNGIEDKDAFIRTEYEYESAAERRRRLRLARPDASVDLHGLNREDAWLRLDAFFADCVRKGFEKVVIIHGKGTHSGQDPVLKRMVRQYLEQNPHAGESDFSARDAGGSGSTWVILK